MSQTLEIKKRWTSNSGFVKNDEGKIIAAVLDECTPEEENTIIIAPVALSAIAKFIAEVNSGSFKLRASIKEFEKIIEFANL